MRSSPAWQQPWAASSGTNTEQRRAPVLYQPPVTVILPLRRLGRVGAACEHGDMVALLQSNLYQERNAGTLLNQLANSINAAAGAKSA